MRAIAILILILGVAQSLCAEVTYKQARLSLEGRKTMRRGTIEFEANHVSFVPLYEQYSDDAVSIVYDEILSMTPGIRKKKFGGATAATSILFGPPGLAMLAANKKFTMVTIETAEDFVTIGVRKRNGTEFLKRLETATGLVVQQAPEQEQVEGSEEVAENGAGADPRGP